MDPEDTHESSSVTSFVVVMVVVSRSDFNFSHIDTPGIQLLYTPGFINHQTIDNDA